MTDPTAQPDPAAQPAQPAPVPPAADAVPPVPQAPAYAPAPAAPEQQAYQPAPAPGAFPGKGLGIAGLVLAFLMPLIGLILSLVAKSQSKKAGVKNTPATVGVIVSIVLLVIEVIALIVVIAILASVSSQIAEACAILGPGVHTVEGFTYTCS